MAIPEGYFYKDGFYWGRDETGPYAWNGSGMTLLGSSSVNFGSGFPTGGVDGDGWVRTDSPYGGVPYYKSGGAWAALDNPYTWTELVALSPASYTGVRVWCSTWNAEFFSDGTNWVPVGKRLQVVRGFVAGSAVVGAIAASYTDTSIIPANLVIAGCDIWFHASYTGVNGTASAAKTAGVYLGSTASTDRMYDVASTAGHNGFAVLARALITAQSGASNTRSNNSISTSNQITGSASSAGSSGLSVITHDWTAATTVLWTATTTSTDSLAVTWRAIEIFYP